jgi:DNA-directed RNA polymerase specialized sigma24 family protein
MDASDDQDPLSIAEQERLHRMSAGLDCLPRLTRAVFLIHRLDDLPYGDVAWRCGITVDEVTLRMADALTVLRWAGDGRSSLMGYVRRQLVPLRSTWMRWRKQRVDRALGIR